MASSSSVARQILGQLLYIVFVRFGEVPTAKKKKLVATGVEVSKNRSVIQDGGSISGLVNRTITTGTQKGGSVLRPQPKVTWAGGYYCSRGRAQVKGKGGEDNGGM